MHVNLLVVGGLLVTALVISLTVLPLIRITLMKRRLARVGIEAEAELLGLKETGLYVNNQPHVKLQVRVRCITGSFNAEIGEVISYFDLNGLRDGGLLRVKYNPEKPAEVMLMR